MTEQPPTAPPGLGTGGHALWSAIVRDHALDAAQLVQLTEACRAKDRLDKLDGLLRGDLDAWARLTYKLRSDENEYVLTIDGALTQANATANLLKQLLAALRLPDDVSGKRPQYRGPRGAQVPSVPGGRPAPVSALDRARVARGA